MAQRALVIGGSGFIGRHLLRMLSADTRFPVIDSVDIIEPKERLSEVRYHQLDATEALPTGLADSSTVIFNLPAHRTYPAFADAEYFRVNLGTTKQILALAEASKVRTILFTSTMSVYRPGDDQRVEDSPVDPVNAYGASKAEAEGLHNQWLERDPARRLVVVRPAVIFGQGDNGNFTRLANGLRRGYFVYVGRSDTIKSNGYVCDLVRSFIFALDRSERRILYNFAYPHRYTIAEIVADMCDVGGYRRPRFVWPARLLEAAAVPFELANALGLRNPIHRKRIAKLYEATNIVPKWLVEKGFDFETDLRSALAEWYAEAPSGEFV